MRLLKTNYPGLAFGYLQDRSRQPCALDLDFGDRRIYIAKLSCGELVIYSSKVLFKAMQLVVPGIRTIHAFWASSQARAI